MYQKYSAVKGRAGLEMEIILLPYLDCVGDVDFVCDVDSVRDSDRVGDIDGVRDVYRMRDIDGVCDIDGSCDVYRVKWQIDRMCDFDTVPHINAVADGYATSDCNTATNRRGSAN